MKSTTYLTAGVIALFVCTISYAQTTTTTGTTIKGTPYLTEAYADGVIFFASNKRTAPIRYNAYKDKVEYKQDGVARELDPTSTIKKVCVDSTTFLVEKFETGDASKLGFFELLDSGKMMLYAKKVVKYIPMLKGRALDGSDKPAEFKRSADEFYYKGEDGVLHEVKNIKSFIAAFPDKQDELSKFAKTEKISSRKEEELVKLVRYYSSL